MADRIKNYQQEADQITTLKEIRTDLGVTPSSYTPDATVVTKDRVVTFAQAEEELVVLSDIEKGVKQQVTEVDIAQKDIANIKALLQGNLYDYQTDSDTAYTKSVPSGAMPYAGLESLGGKTVVWNQYIKNANFDDSTSWSASNGTLTVTDNKATLAAGTSGSYTSLVQSISTATIVGHKYYFSADVSTTQQTRVYLSLAGIRTEANAVDVGIVNHGGYTHGAGIIAPDLSTQGIYIMFVRYDSKEYYIKNVKFIDLTLLYGAGNEPSTVEEFEAMFPADYYAYNAGELLSAGVTEVVSKDANDSTLQTIPIPTAIRNLEGYGWSAGTAYNYVDFERKVFVQNVGRVDLGTLTYVMYGSGTDLVSFTVSASQLPDKKAPSGSGTVDNTINSKYETVTYNTFSSGTVDKVCFGYTNGILGFKDTTYSSASDFKSAMSGVYLYYELATAVETDISQYITDDNLINVESGGTLTFPNSNGTDYLLPVPSEETYMIDLQEAINNG